MIVEDAVWGALLLAAFGGERLPADAEERLTEFAQLASLALASADARERLLESRERLVRTADAERKRLERNLHDGAQQRLVAARLTLGMLRKRLDTAASSTRSSRSWRWRWRSCGSSRAACIRRRSPAACTRPWARWRRGRRCRSSTTWSRAGLPDAIEVAAYYVIAESITNAVKHAEAS